MMNLHCRTCYAPIPFADVDLRQGRARCAHCGAVFAFAQEPGERPPRRERPPVPLPRALAVDDQNGEFRITRRWLNASAFFLVFFCLIWDGILAVFVGGALAGGAPALLAFLSLHLAVGIVLTYYTICLFANRTEIAIDGGALVVRHRPLPWPGNRRVPLEEIDQLHVLERRRRTKQGVSLSYDVLWRDRGGRSSVLVKGLPSPDQALYIEQGLEAALGIKDVPVEGELAR